MAEYDTTNWKRPSACLSPVPPDDVGIGELALGNTYPTMSGDVVRIIRETTYEGGDYFVGLVTTPAGQFEHYFELNGRDWTQNPNNPYAIDWPAVEAAATLEDGWGTI